MADIFHDFPIEAPPSRVYRAVSTPEGLDHWWTEKSSGSPTEGAEYHLSFGPEYRWRAKVTRCVEGSEFELQIVDADEDWNGTRVGFHLVGRDGLTQVRFHHTGWPSPNDHWRTSSYCWAMYLRILKRYLEHDEHVPYKDRLDA